MTAQSHKPNVYQRLASAMREVKYIQKDRKPGMQYTIVSHDVVTAKVRPALLDAGIAYHPVNCEHTQNGNRTECSMIVRFVNVDSPDDFFDVPSFGYGIDSQDKGPGKAMSYAVKYALLKALGLETGDDPDHDSLEHNSNAQPGPTQAEVRDVCADIQEIESLDELVGYWRTLNKTRKHLAASTAVIAAKDMRKGVIEKQCQQGQPT